ncbi:MAG: hypothetical protein RR646_03965 [Erysipelotrichaceae bacterium]
MNEYEYANTKQNCLSFINELEASINKINSLIITVEASINMNEATCKNADDFLSGDILDLWKNCHAKEKKLALELLNGNSSKGINGFKNDLLMLKPKLDLVYSRLASLENKHLMELNNGNGGTR